MDDCSIVRDEHEAEDVTQHIFARLAVALARYEPRSVPFSGWILRVAHNAAIDHIRLHRPVPCDDVRPVTDLDRDDSRERFRDLDAALSTLPDDQRLVIVLRFIVGLTPAEVAARMGRSPDAVHALQHRARRALKGELVRLQAGPMAVVHPASPRRPGPNSHDGNSRPRAAGLPWVRGQPGIQAPQRPPGEGRAGCPSVRRGTPRRCGHERHP